MLHLNSMEEAENVFKALSTPMRLQIMKLIYENENLSMNDLAESLGLTNSAISMHVGKLMDAGLVHIQLTSGKRGTKKLVKPCYHRLMVDLAPKKELTSFHEDQVKIGCYSACSITPTCGLATKDHAIGSFDDIRAFTFPEHFDAGILWFSSGYVEYGLPNHIPPGKPLKALEISFEISSEYPGYNEDYPSDIHFSLNGVPLGMWVSPGDYGARRGHLTPPWWPTYCNQYGLLKVLTLNQEGTFMDGSLKLSNVTINDLMLDYNSLLTFRIEVPRDTTNCGGCTLFGEAFGDYNQSLQIKVFY
ncbi:winged helix-turn-helix transcriptional regulator [Lachnospiraceae bacterium OttesenSCG-928-D06]|nr:winged helix-turn-helix transcriptional regulator [Lachnospiraceae bacterium OttesenSCG-928-D06]